MQSFYVLRQHRFKLLIPCSVAFVCRNYRIRVLVGKYRACYNSHFPAAESEIAKSFDISAQPSRRKKPDSAVKPRSPRKTRFVQFLHNVMFRSIETRPYLRIIHFHPHRLYIVIQIAKMIIKILAVSFFVFQKSCTSVYMCFNHVWEVLVFCQRFLFRIDY